MEREEFLSRVASYAALATADQAEQVTNTVLGTLGDRITAGQAQDLAAYLPTELAAALVATSNSAGAFGRGEFVRRVAGHDGVERGDAELRARAVLRALYEAVPDGEAGDTFAQLPADLYELFR